ncbi:MAG: hypothetical protein V7L23_26315 [Nostoc sp.]|uniref:hypothetical protein n=1 Tax=Nostoc sp. TaxID=1180 RepID=UPI002FF2B1EC
MCVLDVTYPLAIAFLSPSEKKFGEMWLHNSKSLHLKAPSLHQGLDSQCQAIAGFFFPSRPLLYSVG